MCECSQLQAQQLGRIEAGLTYLKNDSARRLADGEEERAKIHDRITAVIKEQTAVNSAIHGRISRVKYLTLGVLAIGASIGAGVDWLKEYLITLGN